MTNAFGRQHEHVFREESKQQVESAFSALTSEAGSLYRDVKSTWYGVSGNRARQCGKMMSTLHRDLN